MTRARRALKATAVVTLFGYAAQALALVSIPLYLQALGAESYGLMVTALAFMGYLGFADAGWGTGSMVLIAQADGRGEQKVIAQIVRHSALLALLSVAMVAAFLSGLLWVAHQGWRLPMFSAHPGSDRLLVLVGIQISMTFLFGVVYNLFHGLQEGYLTGLYQGCARLASILTGMGVAWWTHRVEAVLTAQVVCVGIAGLAAWVHAWRRHPWAFARGSWRCRAQYAQQLRIGAKTFLLQSGRTLMATAPTMAISAVIGPAAVPLYTVPLTLLTLCFVPLNSWGANLQGGFGEAWAAGASDWVRTVYRLTVERTFLIGGLSVAMYLAAGDIFVRLWTDQRLTIAPGVAASIAAVVLVGAWLTCGHYLLTALNRHRQASLGELISGVMAVFLVPLLVGFYGVAGAALGTLASTLLASVWVVWREVREVLGKNAMPPLSFAAKIGAAAVCATGAARLLQDWLPSSPLPQADVLRLVSGCVLATCVYAAVIHLFGLLPAAELRKLARFAASRPPGPKVIPETSS